MFPKQVWTLENSTIRTGLPAAATDIYKLDKIATAEVTVGDALFITITNDGGRHRGPIWGEKHSVL